MLLKAVSLLVLTVAVRLKSGNCSPTLNILYHSPLECKLMLLCLCCRAGLADALHLNSKLFQPETCRKFATQFHGTQRIEIQVGNGPATRANQMVMGMVIGVNAPRAMMRTDFAQHASVHESLEVLVNRRE